MSTVKSILFLNRLRKGSKLLEYFSYEKSTSSLDVYEPRQYLGSILFLHGMSKMGKDDPRMQTMAESMARIGFRVLVPRLQSVSDLRMYRGQPQEIINVAEEIIINESNLTCKPVSLMAVSFTGIFAMKLLTRSELKQRIGPVSMIGAYSRFKQVAKYLLFSKRADLYGRFLLYKNYLVEYGKCSDNLLHSIEIAMEISSRFTNQQAVVSTLQREYPAAYNDLKDLLLNPTFDSQIIQNMILFVNEYLSGYQLPALDTIQANPVFILHGRSDRVIPSGEARSLANRLGKAGFDVQLCLTKFLSHGDTSIQIKDLIPLWQLISSFSWYFDKVKSYKGSFHVESN